MKKQKRGNLKKIALVIQLAQFLFAAATEGVALLLRVYFDGGGSSLRFRLLPREVNAILNRCTVGRLALALVSSARFNILSISVDLNSEP